MSYTKLLGSPILFRILVRFVFMTIVLSSNKRTASPEVSFCFSIFSSPHFFLNFLSIFSYCLSILLLKCIPKAIPAIPSEVLDNPDVRKSFVELVSAAGVADIYNTK